MSLDGETLKSVDTNRLPFGNRIIDANGYIYLYKRARRAEGREELIKFDPTFTPIITFHSFEKIIKPRVMNPFPIRYYFTLSEQNNFICLLSSDYNIHVFDAYGKTLKRIIKDHDPVKITKEDKAQILQKENSQPIGLRRNIEFPKYYPVASGLFIDEQNRIYVRTFEKDDKGGLYHDIFDSEGRYISRFSINKNEKVVVINNNKIYCIINENEEGIPLVKRYRIEWKQYTKM